MLPNQRAYKVPARTILATIGPALATAVAVVIVMHLQRVLVWMLIAAVFTRRALPCGELAAEPGEVVPPLAGDAGRVPRGFLASGGVLTLFAIPLAEQGTQLATRPPDMIADARGGRGPVGILLERTRQFATGLGTPALNLLRRAITGIVAAGF